MTMKHNYLWPTLQIVYYSHCNISEHLTYNKKYRGRENNCYTLKPVNRFLSWNRRKHTACSAHRFFFILFSNKEPVNRLTMFAVSIQASMKIITWLLLCLQQCKPKAICQRRCHDLSHLFFCVEMHRQCKHQVASGGCWPAFTTIRASMKELALKFFWKPKGRKSVTPSSSMAANK